MFHWICPECGLECPPSSRECPECDRQSVSQREREASTALAAASVLKTPPAVPEYDLAPVGVGLATAVPVSREQVFSNGHGGNPQAGNGCDGRSLITNREETHRESDIESDPRRVPVSLLSLSDKIVEIPVQEAVQTDLEHTVADDSDLTPEPVASPPAAVEAVQGIQREEVVPAAEPEIEATEISVPDAVLSRPLDTAATESTVDGAERALKLEPAHGIELPAPPETAGLIEESAAEEVVGETVAAAAIESIECIEVKGASESAAPIARPREAIAASDTPVEPIEAPAFQQASEHVELALAQPEQVAARVEEAPEASQVESKLESKLDPGSERSGPAEAADSGDALDAEFTALFGLGQEEVSSVPPVPVSEGALEPVLPETQYEAASETVLAVPSEVAAQSEALAYETAPLETAELPASNVVEAAGSPLETAGVVFLEIDRAQVETEKLLSVEPDTKPEAGPEAEAGPEPQAEPQALAEAKPLEETVVQEIAAGENTVEEVVGIAPSANTRSADAASTETSSFVEDATPVVESGVPAISGDAPLDLALVDDAVIDDAAIDDTQTLVSIEARPGSLIEIRDLVGNTVHTEIQEVSLEQAIDELAIIEEVTAWESNHQDEAIDRLGVIDPVEAKQPEAALEVEAEAQTTLPPPTVSAVLEQPSNTRPVVSVPEHEAARVEPQHDRELETVASASGSENILSLVEAVDTATVTPATVQAAAELLSPEFAMPLSVETEAHSLATNETLRIPLARMPAAVELAAAEVVAIVERPRTLRRPSNEPPEVFERPTTLRRPGNQPLDGAHSGGPYHGNDVPESREASTAQARFAPSLYEQPPYEQPRYESPAFEQPKFVDPPFIDMTPRQIFPEPHLEHHVGQNALAEAAPAPHDRAAAELAGLLGLAPQALQSKPNDFTEPALAGFKSTVDLTLPMIRAAQPDHQIYAPDAGPKITLPSPALTPELTQREGLSVLTDDGQQARAKGGHGAPSWLVSGLVTLLVFGAGLGALAYFGPLDSSIFGGKPATKPVEAVETVVGPNPTTTPGVTAGASHPLSKYIELTGVRIVVESSRKSEVHYLVVNHSSAEIADVTVRATVRNARRPNGAPLTAFTFRLPSLGPYESKEMVVPIEKLSRGFELPDWQNLKTDFQITGQ